MKTRVGLVTIGQAPRVDIVPEMADLMGPAVEVVERGALDGLGAAEIASLAPVGDDEVLITRLSDGASVFVGKSHITPRIQQQIRALEDDDVAISVVLCTGAFQGLESGRPLVQPEKMLLGVLRGIRFPGRLGVLAPSARHVPQTEARWRAHGFDPAVAPLSPYGRSAGDAAGIEPRAVEAMRVGGAGLVLLDCMGFRRDAQRAVHAALGVPVIVANLLVARVVAEMVGA